MDQQLSLANIEQSDNEVHLKKSDNQLILIKCYDVMSPNNEEEDNDDDDRVTFKTLIDHNWCKKILDLVGNKAQLMESFAWLSTVGGGFSALGETDSKFSYRAGALSVGQQLHLAELLGDDRLKVMCHLFVALASLQLGNKKFCINYCSRVIVPLLNKLPFKDQMLRNMLRHIIFRVKTLEKFKNVRALKGKEN